MSKYKISKELIEAVPFIDKASEEFFKYYEDQYDFSYQVYDRGLTLQFFIQEKRPDFNWIFEKPKPEHISEIPEEIREEYKAYLREELMNFWGMDTIKEFEEHYTIEHAFEEFVYAHIDDNGELII